MKNSFLRLLAILLLAVLAACGSEEASTENKKELTIGFGVGTYEEQFRHGILPILEEQGYKIEIKTF